MSSANLPTSEDMRKPIPFIGEPKNSATIAPISAKVEQIFNPLKTNGKADGNLNLKRVCK